MKETRKQTRSVGVVDSVQDMRGAAWERSRGMRQGKKRQDKETRKEGNIVYTVGMCGWADRRVVVQWTWKTNEKGGGMS
jgi:hypothetical protein